VLLLAVVYTPFLNSVFDTIPLGWSQWAIVLPLLFIPAIAAEVTKYIAMWSANKRQKEID
jgi:P-type Ca2+ transporter type 2C